MSSRSRAIARKGGSPARTASGSRPSTSSSQLKRIGARPLPGQKDYRLPFEFTAGTKDGGSRLSVAPTNRTFTQRSDIQALSFSDNGEVSGQVVFAGYGIVAPESEDFGYDSYAALDVKDKVVVVLRYFPEDADPKTKGILARYSGQRYKAMAARQRGAKALLVVTGPRSPNAGRNGADDLRYRAGRFGNRRRQHQRRGRRGDPREHRQVARGGAAQLRLRQPACGRVRRTERDSHRGRQRRARETDGLQHRRVPAGDAPEPTARGRSRGSPSARTTITSGAARTATRSPAATSAGRVHYGADDNASGSAAVLAVGEQFRQADAPAQRAARVLVGRGAGADRIVGVRKRAARPAPARSRRTSTSTWSAGCRTTS